MTEVTLIATGGTIASRRSAGENSVTASMDGSSLLSTLHDPLDGISVSVEEFRAVGSYALDLPTVHDLIGRIRDALDADDCAGVVVTHGTDTMEESCFLADLLIDSPKPVVFTGAQRHAGAPDTDGPRNIADSIRVAAASNAQGRGAMICFEGDIHGARDVSKVHTSRVDTFRSPGLGKLGEVDLGSVKFYRMPQPRIVQTDCGIVPEVELVKLSLGCTPKYLEFCAETGTKGVVLEAFGRGNAPTGFADAVGRLTRAGIPVVVASRCAEGRTHAVYGADSGGVSLVENGAILAGALSGVKARLLLSVLLAGGADHGRIAATFQTA